eukprot:g7437.t1
MRRMQGMLVLLLALTLLYVGILMSSRLPHLQPINHAQPPAGAGKAVRRYHQQPLKTLLKLWDVRLKRFGRGATAGAEAHGLALALCEAMRVRHGGGGAALPTKRLRRLWSSAALDCDKTDAQMLRALAAEGATPADNARRGLSSVPEET